ncbi:MULTISPECIES: ABC-type transport auxiliary lipoprotein family protein [unclassified Duganella]|uniref:ABC-type transport auxiliary lipoprotein family protein n=1 Tax=unclassified Duganella TaxID=2636909 RepID=UPI000701A2E1|nr:MULTISPECIES: ABC-type transport auxiliary lipoprotein family protein [unclassified Duganella]KQV52549.1 ABC transporter [Duganella sp. Root336D2]KRB90566.1 ABC transporter [Duganella sp. Root198D2]
MKKNILLTAVVAAAAALAGCASKGPQPTSYDFGPMGAPLAPASLAPSGADSSSGTSGTNGANGAGSPAAGIPALVVSDVSGPASLDTQRMYYRLMYADARQSRPYAYNNWSVTPLQLMSQRLKARIAQSGVKVVSTTDAAGGLPLLRLEADEFAQNFDSATQSSASVTLRASVFRNHKLVDQRTFSRTARAASADAAGGAGALAESTDGIAADILAWLANMPK